MTILTEDLRKLLGEATPRPLSAHKSAVFDAHGHCIAICTTGINRVEDHQANARGMALWCCLATELLAARAKIEAAEKLVDALAWLMEHRSFCDIPSIEGEWDERANAALDAWEAAQ